MDIIPFSLVEAVPLQSIQKSKYSKASGRKELDEKSFTDCLIESVLTASYGPSQNTKQYKCDVCDKSFPAFQALGGHKSIHNTNNKRIRNDSTNNVVAKSRKRARCLELFPTSSETGNAFECDICSKAFSSSQALGGHKSSHKRTYEPTSIVPRYLQLFPESAETESASSCSKKPGEIDLELRLGF